MRRWEDNVLHHKRIEPVNRGMGEPVKWPTYLLRRLTGSPILRFAVLLLALRAPAQAATLSVKAGGGGNYTTIQACANVAVAGDICMVYAGTYSGWTQPNNGST